ncbi:uncharacterized protein [Centruroides vittatus]|uniref:uncharacterized protein isoform X1 n=1 Tax=Centruroides vittatus TaxID=120091 RepID=UPI00350FC8F1
MMKWRIVRRNHSIDSEVKSSLDLLDSILAEYEQDDDKVASSFTSWITSDDNETENLSHSWQSKKPDKVINYRHSLPSDVSQLRKIPPTPPIRSPTTRLSYSDPYGYDFLSRPVPIFVGHRPNKRPTSLIEKPTMVTFGHVASQVHSDNPPDHPVFETHAESIPYDFRQSLHFDVFGSQKNYYSDQHEKSKLINVGKKRKPKWKKI